MRAFLLLFSVGTAHATCMPALDECTVMWVDADCQPLDQPGEIIRGVWLCPDSVCCAGERCHTSYAPADLRVRRVGEQVVDTGLQFEPADQTCDIVDPDGSRMLEAEAPTMGVEVVAFDTRVLQPGHYAVQGFEFDVREPSAPMEVVDWPPGFPELEDGVHARQSAEAGTVQLPWLFGATHTMGLVRELLAQWAIVGDRPDVFFARRDGVLAWVSVIGSPTGTPVVTWQTRDLPAERWWEAGCPDGAVLEGEEGRELHCARGGTPHGPFTSWVDGFATGHHVDGEVHGDWLEVRGWQVTVGTWDDGARHGMWETRDGMGQLVERGRYARGERDGPWVMTTPEGRREAAHWCAGVRCGVWSQSDGSGRVLAEGAYDTEGRESGVWRTYFAHNGALQTEVHWERGERHGTETTWWGTGQRWTTGTWEHGVRVGVWRTRDGDGSVEKVERFVEGERVRMKRRVCREDGFRQVCRWDRDR